MHEIVYYSSKEHLKISRIAKFDDAGNVIKLRKYSLAKFANLGCIFHVL